MKQQAINILEKIRHEIDRNKTQKFLQWNISQNKFEIESWKCEVLYRAISELQALWDGWISTAVKLPPEDTNVLIFEWWQSISWWNEPKIWWYNKKFWFQSLTDYLIATHWMNLPDSPK